MTGFIVRRVLSMLVLKVTAAEPTSAGRSGL